MENGTYSFSFVRPLWIPIPLGITVMLFRVCGNCNIWHELRLFFCFGSEFKYIYDKNFFLFLQALCQYIQQPERKGMI